MADADATVIAFPPSRLGEAICELPENEGRAAWID
jgi:hypothetical protein